MLSTNGRRALNSGQCTINSIFSFLSFQRPALLGIASGQSTFLLPSCNDAKRDANIFSFSSFNRNLESNGGGDGGEKRDPIRKLAQPDESAQEIEALVQSLAFLLNLFTHMGVRET